MTDPTPEAPPGAGNTSLIEKTVVLLLFALLVAGVFLILRPFSVGLMFGAILAVAAWPVRTWLVKSGLSGGTAAIVMLATLLLFVLVPIGVTAPGLADDLRSLGERTVAWITSSPEPPGWIATLPVIGQKLDAQWRAASAGTPEFQAMLTPYARPIRVFFTDAAVGLAGSILQLALALVIATTFWSHGSSIVAVLREGLSRLGGAGLAGMVDVAGNAIKGVFYGIVGTAAAQGALMAAGLMVAGVPGALPLGFVTLLLAISQLGSVLINLVWAGAAWWLYGTSGPGLAFWFVIGWGLFVTVIDNILKPWLIGSSMEMPIMLVILGVFGGFISFGFLGLFIGPTLIAIAYALVVAWTGIRAQDRTP
jgi:predicted PurR-regulated permease PerM